MQAFLPDVARTRAIFGAGFLSEKMLKCLRAIPSASLQLQCSPKRASLSESYFALKKKFPCLQDCLEMGKISDKAIEFESNIAS